MAYVHGADLGAALMESHRSTDARGSFIRIWDAREVALLRGAGCLVAEAAVVSNGPFWTMRGLHVQRGGGRRSKVLTVLSGRIFDVMLDVRVGSPTYGLASWCELGAGDAASLYVPEGLAHGYLTLESDTVVSYLMSRLHSPEEYVRVQAADPLLGVPWPADPESWLTSEEDAGAAPLRDTDPEILPKYIDPRAGLR